MSLNLDPSIYSYEPAPNVCPAVFGADTTPDQIFLQLTDIKKGAWWIPANGEPPNGIHILTPTNPCQFGLTTAAFLFELSWDGSDTILSIYTWGMAAVFWRTTAYPPVTWFQNTPQTPVGNFFYDGFAALTIEIPCDQPNTPALWESLGETPDAETWDNPLAASSGSVIHTFSRRKDHTNIKIKWLPE